ncbi:MAG: CRISPR-associated endonuclease Cas1 [Lentilitoribacter sp.]
MDQSSNDATNLWLRITEMEALQGAWYKVKTNAGSAGGDGINLRDFQSDLFANLTQLRSEVLGGTYKSSPFKKVSVPKKKPGYRILTIPSIRDRVLHTSIATALTQIFEPLFEESSFAYRPNRGVVHAVERIEKWRNRGFDVVIEADIVSYFDNVLHEILLDKVSSIIAPLDGAAAIIALLKLLLDDQSQALGSVGKGIVQGSPLSPLLANLYLDALDEEIEEQGVKIVRFADDFVILCKSEKKAKRVLEYCVSVLNELGLRLHQDGTRIVSFDKGFDFIGYMFLRTLALKEKTDPSQKKKSKPVKSEVTDEGIIELDKVGSRYDPGKRVLYVLDLNHSLTIRNRSFSVQRLDGTELIAIPYKRIGRIEIGPKIKFTRAVIDLSIEANIAVSILDGWGQTKGNVLNNHSRRSGLQFKQAQSIINQQFRKQIALTLVEARIKNQRTQLYRLARDKKTSEVELTLDALKQTLRRLPSIKTIDELRGYEGSATAKYWSAISELTQPFKSISFKRSRPAKDPLNATINYMTGILERDIRAAIQSCDLHCGFAFLHGSRDYHQGLVYDLMEPFRAYLTEGIPVFLFNSNRLKEEMFNHIEKDSVQISDEGRNAIVNAYETAIARRINIPGTQRKLGWRAMMQHQANSLVKAVTKNEPSLFTPYIMEA